MSQTPQTHFGPFAPPPNMPGMRKRPELDLGPMTGSVEYIVDRSQSLVRTFSSLLEKDFALIDFPYGCTDCKTFIKAPLSSSPEAYLVVEHELSHCLFGTDLAMTEAFREKAVDRLLRRAKIAPTSPDALPYKDKLDALVHHLWNILEDHRCRWLWAQIYPGGGELLRQRWYGIADCEMEQQAETDLLTYLGRRAAGIETPTAPPEFQSCGVHMKRAKNLVEGVDAGSCLAITARLIDQIADELLKKYPPNKVQEAKAKLKALIGAVNPGSGGKGQGDVDDNPMGGKDIEPPIGKKQRPTAGQIKRILQVLTAKEDDENPDYDGLSSFSALLQEGADRMEEKIEQARAAMAMPKMNSEQQSEKTLSTACRIAAVPSAFVTPTQKLPRPSPGAMRIRQHLERVRMKKRRQAHFEGDLDVEAYIEARVNRELHEAKFFTRDKKEAGMELLLLADLSGSMMGFGLDLVERAIADIEFACTDLKVEIELWGFSHMVFFFKKLGSPKNATGVIHSSTNMVQALDVAYQWALSSSKTRGVILMTDGMPTSCRGRRSSGDVFQDLYDVIHEMKEDGVVLSVLAIGDENTKQWYDKGFGPKQYALLPNVAALSKALPDTAKLLVEAHIKRSYR